MVRGADAVRVLAPRTCEGGDTSAHTGIGGSPSPVYLSKKECEIRTANTEREFCFTLCCREFVLPPPPGLRTGGTPLVNAGGKASNRPRTLTAIQVPTCCIAVLSRYVHRKMSNTNTRRCLTIMRQRRVLGLISGIPGPPGSGDPPAGSVGYNRSARRFPPPPVPPHPA